MLTIIEDPSTSSRKLMFEAILDRSFDNDHQVVKGVVSQMVEELSKELKPEVSEAIKRNIDQLVKDVGKEIVIAGLRELLFKDEEKKKV